jgi:hypothetical protein
MYDFFKSATIPHHTLSNARNPILLFLCSLNMLGWAVLGAFPFSCAGSAPTFLGVGLKAGAGWSLGVISAIFGGGLKSLAPSALSSSVFTHRFFSESHKICTNSSKILPKLSKLTHRGVLVVGELHLVFGLEGELAEDPAEPAAAPGFVQRGLRGFCRLGRGVLLRLLILLVAADFSIVLVGQRNLGLRDVLRKKHRATIYYTSGSAWGRLSCLGGCSARLLICA